MSSLFITVFILFPLSCVFLFHNQHLSIFMIKSKRCGSSGVHSVSVPLAPQAWRGEAVAECDALRLRGVMRWRRRRDRLIVHVKEQHLRAALGKHVGPGHEQTVLGTRLEVKAGAAGAGSRLDARHCGVVVWVGLLE